MSRNLSRAVQPFCTSVICGKDVVPRLSVVNIGRLIDQMVRRLFNGIRFWGQDAAELACLNP